MMKTIKKLITVALIIAGVVFVTGCGSGNQGGNTKVSGTVTVSGAFALYPMAVKWAEEFQKLNPGVRIDISAGGAGKGMMDCLSGMVDLGMVSRSISPEESAKGAISYAVTRDAVLPTCNAANPCMKDILEKGITKEGFTRIFLSKQALTWGEVMGNSSKEKVNVYTRSDACGAAEMWGKYLGKNQEGLNGIGVYGDPGIADAVKNDKLGIGYNNLNYAFDFKTRKLYPGIQVIPIDINGNGKVDPEEKFYDHVDQVMDAVRTGKYPSPPARDLFFVSKGKLSNKAAIAFLEWILTDGQKFVKEAGYVELAAEKIKQEQDKLKK